MSSAFDVLGFGPASGADGVLRYLVVARIIEPTSTYDSLRVLAQAGIETVSHPTITLRLQAYSVG